MHEPTPEQLREKLVALLYNELDDTETRAVREELERNPALRAEWDEISSARTVLSGLAGAETPSGFEFLVPEIPESTDRSAAPVSRTPRDQGRLAGIMTWIRGTGGGPVWAAAAALVMVAVLGISGFRVQKIPGGFALGFGDAPVQTLPASGGAQVDGTLVANSPGAANLGIADPNGTRSLADGVQVTPVSAGAEYLTRSDMADYETEMFQVVSAMFHDYENYRDQELAGIVRMMYSEMNNRQIQTYDDLRGRIEAVNVGLMLEKNQSDARYNDLMQSGGENRSLDDAPNPNEE